VPDLEEYLETRRRLVDAELALVLPRADEEPARLHEAMRYSVLAGGKRLRPIFVLASAETAASAGAATIHTAAAVELVHTYSLIHDDLPAMDDDALRRGKPTCHVKFGEATAILAGDALLTLAFEVLAGRVEDARVAQQLIGELSRAAGAHGMVGGQEMDLAAEGGEVSREAVEAIHRRKTAALIVACVRMGAISAGARESDFVELGRYGELVGLAFQIADDILDATSSAEALGKSPGKDAAQRKATYPAAVGIEAARDRALLLADEAKECLARFGDRAWPLRALADFAVRRES